MASGLDDDVNVTEPKAKRARQDDDETPHSPTEDEIFFLTYTKSTRRTKTVRERIMECTQRDSQEKIVSPMLYWQKVEASDPAMARLAKIVLALPVTQVTVERAFSHLPLVLTDRRNRLHGQTMDDLFMIKFNGFK